ncbi:glycosyltransferase family 2 protein [Blautia sp. HCN-1074]|jgi:glycosyltransferase involved in cell wall biosynthesis|uniref:glycosyltransferase family 2 protein n=1 Tax=Blautia sp. HCN-1074 TaxID=3134667 RepID=UPI000E5CF19E|nr:glycosyltransferase family 2 protein [Ruminococcus sp. AM46-18]
MHSYILTVSIAAYNVEEYIRETLDSFTNIIGTGLVEILIIDDGSTDNTAKIAKEYVNKDSNTFKVISKKNGGWGSTVNCGINNSHGKYFKQLDGDDLFNKKNLKEFITFLENSEADLIISPFHSFSDDTGETISRISYPQIQNMQKKLSMEDVAKFYPYMEMHSSCFKTSLIKDIRLQEHCFYTDVELMVKAVSKVKSVSYFEKDIYCYRLGRVGQSVSSEGLIKHYKEHEKICLILSEFCAQYSGSEKIKELLIQRTNYMIENQYKIYFLIGKQQNNKKEIREFDSTIKNRFKFLYDKCRSKKMKIMRKTGFIGYKLCCRMTKN